MMVSGFTYEPAAAIVERGERSVSGLDSGRGGAIPFTAARLIRKR
jgi:hypothetical protein